MRGVKNLLDIHTKVLYIDSAVTDISPGRKKLTGILSYAYRFKFVVDESNGSSLLKGSARGINNEIKSNG